MNLYNFFLKFKFKQPIYHINIINSFLRIILYIVVLVNHQFLELSSINTHSQYPILSFLSKHKSAN